MLHLKVEVSKVDYSSRAKGSNVRGVGAFFDTYSDLPFTQNSNPKIYVICIRYILYKTFRDQFFNQCEISV